MSEKEKNWVFLVFFLWTFLVGSVLSSTYLVQFNFFLFIMSFRQRGCELYELYQQEFLRYDDLLEVCKEIIENCEEFLT